MKLSPVIHTILSLCLLSACSTFSDVSYDQKANVQLKLLADSSIKAAQSAEPLSLSTLLSTSEVEQLIDLALQNNPSLQQTLLTLKTAQQQVTSTSAAQLPAINAGLDANKQENSTATYNPSLSVSWTIDIWQQLSNATSAQQANLAASAYAYQGARDLLAANVMKSYLELVQLAQLIDVETRRVATLKTNEDVIVDRYRKGLIDLKDLDTAKSSTQSSQATLVDYQAQYDKALRDLSLLTGLTQKQAQLELAYRKQFPDVMMPIQAIQSQNLARRPDLQQAYQAIIAGQYQHKVAYKSLLPSLTLSGSLNGSSANLHDALFGSNAWQLLGQITAPIFNAGKLESEAEIAKLSAEQKYWAFQESLLTAVNEVENALAQEIALDSRISLTQAALESAQRSEATYTSRYRQGTSSLIDLLQVQQETFSLEAQVTQLTYQRLNNRISLGLALGLGV